MKRKGRRLKGKTQISKSNSPLWHMHKKGQRWQYTEAYQVITNAFRNNYMWLISPIFLNEFLIDEIGSLLIWQFSSPIILFQTRLRHLGGIGRWTETKDRLQKNDSEDERCDTKLFIDLFRYYSHAYQTTALLNTTTGTLAQHEHPFASSTPAGRALWNGKFQNWNWN